MCTTCSNGFASNTNGQCIQYSVANCQTVANDMCTKCLPNFQISQGKCLSQLPMPLGCILMIGSSCAICAPGYNINTQSTCDPASNKQTDPNCQMYSGNICIKCSSFFYIGQNNFCTPVSPLCNTYNPTNGYCITCFSGFSIQTNGACTINPTILPTNCATVDQNGACLTCLVGFVVSKGLCVKQNLLCKTSNLDGTCSSCYSGWTPSSGTCVLSSSLVPNC